MRGSDRRITLPERALQMKKVVLASILKPVDDTRMFWKMAGSLAAANQFKVTVIGFGERPVSHETIATIPLGRYPRLGVGRLLAAGRVLLICFKVKPDIFIATTHELLLVAIANRILFGAKIWYDVQENYYRNIRFGGVFPAWLAAVLARWVRGKEQLLLRFFNGAFVAEKCYPSEMPFLRHRAVVLENKALPSPRRVRARSGQPFTFLFSGTLAETTGVFHAIALVGQIHAIEPAVRLIVAGHCIRESEQKKIQQHCAGKPFIELRGVTHLLPHTQIEQAMAEADAGIVSYPRSPHTHGRIPTKLYEYLAHQLPVVCMDHPVWNKLITDCQAGVTTRFAGAADVWPAIRDGRFYPQPPQHVHWHEEALRLLACLDASSD